MPVYGVTIKNEIPENTQDSFFGQTFKEVGERMGKSDVNLLEPNKSQRYLDRAKGENSIKSDTENKSSVVTLRKRVHSNMRDFSDESDYEQDGHRVKNKNSIARDKVGFHIL